MTRTPSLKHSILQGLTISRLVREISLQSPILGGQRGGTIAKFSERVLIFKRAIVVTPRQTSPTRQLAYGGYRAYRRRTL